MQRLLSGAQQGRQIMQTTSNPTGAMVTPGGNPMQMMQQFAQLKSMASSMRDILR